MAKEFDTWNVRKKEIHETGESRFYKAAEVWWCSLGINIGFEQDGTGKGFQRPVIIMRGFSRQVCLIVPLTTSKKKNPYHISVGIIEGKQAFAILSQVRLIDTKRLINRIAIVNDELFETIKKAIKDLL